MDQKALEARQSGKLQKDLTFYKNIVQIEFNAWQYMEGNLWASLVEHIFKNLIATGREKEDAIRLAQEKLLEGLGEARKDKARADEQLQTAQDELAAAETKLQDTQTALENKTRTMAASERREHY